MDDSIKFLKAHIKLYLVFLISFGECERKMHRAID